LYDWQGGPPAKPARVQAEVSGISGVGDYVQTGAVLPSARSVGLFPPEGLGDWLVLGVIGFLGYKFFYDPHAGTTRRARVGQAASFGRTQVGKLLK